MSNRIELEFLLQPGRAEIGNMAWLDVRLSRARDSLTWNDRDWLKPLKLIREPEQSMGAAPDVRCLVKCGQNRWALAISPPSVSVLTMTSLRNSCRPDCMMSSTLA